MYIYYIGVIPGSREARQLLSPSPRGGIPRDNLSRYNMVYITHQMYL